MYVGSVYVCERAALHEKAICENLSYLDHAIRGAQTLAFFSPLRYIYNERYYIGGSFVSTLFISRQYKNIAARVREHRALVGMYRCTNCDENLLGLC
jgi:hypothetical protein